MLWGRALLLVALVACTKSNPAKHCADGTCIDPSFPFCDVTGAVAGEVGACIAASCTADEFVECRGDVEVRCNVDGSDYNLSQCDLGCDAAADGCRLCNPNETACTNGKVATCDASGTLTSSAACPLGCFENEPRCREIAPSNDLAEYFDMVPSPPSLTLEMGVFDVSTGEVTDNGIPITVPSFGVPAPAGGVAMRVFVVDQLTITQATTTSSGASTALVILARGSISIVGKLASYNGSGTNLTTCAAGDGVTSGSCVYSSSAGGGGAFASNGAKGGDVLNTNQQVVNAGGSGGIANGNERLVPLRGGCPGGRHRYSGNYYPRLGGYGGGALQLVSSMRIDIRGIIDVAGVVGGGGDADPNNTGGPPYYNYFVGGGAGGGILLEAPTISLDANALLDARGGDGGGCTSGTALCGAAGNGSVQAAATPGGNATCDGVSQPVGAGGGGGLGRIRINTRDGAYSKTNTSIEYGVLSAGMIETR